MTACTAPIVSLEPPPVVSPWKGLGTYGRVRRFLDGHYEELLPELLILGAFLIAGVAKLV